MGNTHTRRPRAPTTSQPTRDVDTRTLQQHDLPALLESEGFLAIKVTSCRVRVWRRPALCHLGDMPGGPVQDLFPITIANIFVLAFSICKNILVPSRRQPRFSERILISRPNLRPGSCLVACCGDTSVLGECT